MMDIAGIDGSSSDNFFECSIVDVVFCIKYHLEHCKRNVVHRLLGLGWSNGKNQLPEYLRGLPGHRILPYHVFYNSLSGLQ